MKVTRIAAQQRRQGRYSVFVDGRYVFSLGGDALLESKLTVGQELSSDDLLRWRQVSADDKAYASALRHAALRLRSTWEMEQYLKRKHTSPALIHKILNKLSSIRLLDDAAFAKAWVTNRRLLRPTSKRKLQQELRAKGVPDQVIDVTLSGEADNERSVLTVLIAKKRLLPKYRAEPLKLMGYLARQGFSYDDIKTAFRDTEH